MPHLVFYAIFVRMKKEYIMNSVRIVLCLLLSVILFSCGDKKAAVCVTAYEKAARDVQKAENSEALLEISYALNLELQSAGNVCKDDDVAKARRDFEKALKSKEMEFYSASRKKR